MDPGMAVNRKLRVVLNGKASQLGFFLIGVIFLGHHLRCVKQIWGSKAKNCLVWSLVFPIKILYSVGQYIVSDKWRLSVAGCVARHPGTSDLARSLYVSRKTPETETQTGNIKVKF